MLHQQLEVARLGVQHRLTARSQLLKQLHSVRGVVAALAGMAGLSSEPISMYQVIGFDALHVSLSSLARCRATYVLPFDRLTDLLSGYSWCVPTHALVITA